MISNVRLKLDEEKQPYVNLINSIENLMSIIRKTSISILSHYKQDKIELLISKNIRKFSNYI